MGKNKRENKIKFFLFITIVAVSLFILFKNREYIMSLDIDKVAEFIGERGILAIFIYMFIYFLKPFFVVIPSNIIAIIGGTLFGPVKGFILTMIGFWISATIAFYLSRFLGRDFVEGIVGKRLVNLDNNIEKNGFKILFMLRLPPILPYDPLSYACGFTKINYRDFIAASLLGVVPETICYSILGRNFDNLLSYKCIVPIMILILGVVFSKRIMNYKKAN
ncbi:TVP38/TMEM64 family protein [Clostridium paraputrificum]|uniref:TVP38/TMEM64 family protein n=1 Tax=Clostridium TaxID=1485 RepID=UPI003D348930